MYLILSMNANIMKTQFSLNHIWPKMHFYVIEKLCDFFTLRPSDLNTTLTYALFYNFFNCFQIFLGFLMEMLMQCRSRYILTINKKIYKWVNETYSTLDWLKSLIDWHFWSKKRVNYLSCIEEKGCGKDIYWSAKNVALFVDL